MALTILLIAASLLNAAAAGNPPVVLVDNSVSQTHYAIEGVVFDNDPAHAKIGVKNLHDFYTNVKIFDSALSVKLTPANPLKGGNDVGGVYAAIGAVGPNDTAVWDATFNTTGSASQLFFTTPTLQYGSPTAGVLNLVTIIVTVVGGVPKVDSIAKVQEAINAIGQASDCAEAAKEMGAVVPPLSVAVHIVRCLNDDTQVAVVQEALKDLNVLVTKSALKKAFTVYDIWQLAKMTDDMGLAIVLGTYSGSVRFYEPNRQVVESAPTATATPSPTATPTPVPTPQPSGTWIEPADSTEVLGATVHFAAHAYPVHAGDPSIDHVNFTVWWSTMGPKSGPWKTVCTATRPASGDLFQCDADLSTLDPEPDWNTAELLVSFDVYDVHKNHTLAPDGEHVLRWVPTAADDYEIRKYYPLAQFLPYNSDDFDVGYYTDKLTLPVTIKTPDVARAKQEVRDWIQSHGVDPSTHQLIWTTPAATQPSDPIAFVGTGCSPSPLPSALQSNRFSGVSETCYNFIFSGFGGAWPLIALDVIQPDGIYTQGDPAGVITGNGVTGYVPDQFGFILFFSSATSYPNGSWKIHVEDRAGHDVDAAFTYPVN